MRAQLQIGQIVLDKPLGQGGMAEVWLGRNVHLGTPVAVKYLNAQFAGNGEMQARFLEEGRRQAELSHPNIVKVFGWEVLEGRSFLILQYVHGEPLDLRLHRAGPVPAELFWKICEGILGALQHAHSKRMVHRDVKPSNILLDEGGNPYLGDFGLVVAFDQQRLTRTGTSMGTPEYMSPEQIQNPGAVDHRSDIYSFGCVMFEMLTGRVPFEGESFQTKLAHLNAAPPSPRPFNPQVPAGLEQVVLRCLAKQPGDRFGSCEELFAALRGGVAVPLPKPAPVPQPTPWWVPLVVFACLLLLGGGGSYWVYLQMRAATPPVARVDPPPSAPVDPKPGEVVRPPSVTPGPGPSLDPGPGTLPKSNSTPAVNPKKEIVEPPAEEPKPAVSASPASGSLTWSGHVDKGDRVTIEGMKASIGAVRGVELPKESWLELRLNNKDFGVAESPSVRNGNRIVLRAGKKGDLKVTIYWSVAQ